MNSIRNLILLAAALCGLALLPFSALAQDAAVSPIVLPPEAQNFLLEMLVRLAGEYPWVATLVAFAGTMRLWAKPFFTLVHSIVEITPSKFDDGLWATAYKFLTEHPAGRFLAYLLDWFASVKIAPPQPKPDADQP